MKRPRLVPVLGRRRANRGAPRRTRRRSVLLLALMALLTLTPLAPASAAVPDPPFSTNPNDACRPADSPAPEAYGSGTDGLIKPPDYPSEKLRKTPAQRLTYYDRYGTAGQSWYAVDMGCSDAMALMGNSVANTVFTLVRAIDRTTISVYQAAASESLLGWLKKTVDGVISGIGKTFNAKYWAWVVILGAMWLAWWGLIHKRASKVAEGTIWMVAAMVALIWLVARPADFTTLGTKVSEATSTAFNAALPQSDTKGTVCVPPPPGEAKVDAGELDATTRNANGLWVALVCKPWLMGEFGTTDPNAPIVKDNADKLLWSQAVDLPETYGGEKVDLAAKAKAYEEVAAKVKEENPGAYPVFQGKQWTSRLAVAFGALFAALVAGLLVLVIAIALIVVKIAFLLLLVAGPIFLGIGIHPGIGRVIAVRWLELLLSMLLKQAALIGVLALLLWAYGLILGETLPWGLQILLIALVTGAAFVYRKPFQHLFAAVGYSAVGSRAKSDEQLDKSIAAVRKSTLDVATAAVPGAAGYQIARWSKRDPAMAPAMGDTVAASDRAGGGTADGNADPTGVIASKTRGAGAGVAGAGSTRGGAPPLKLPSGGGGGATGAGHGSAGGRGTGAAAGTASGAGVASGQGIRSGGGLAGVVRGGGTTAGAAPPPVTAPHKAGGPASGGSGDGGGGGAGSGGSGGTSRPTSWASGRAGSGGSGGSAGSAGSAGSGRSGSERPAGAAGGGAAGAGGGSGGGSGGGASGRSAGSGGERVRAGGGGRRGKTPGGGRDGGSGGRSRDGGRGGQGGRGGSAGGGRSGSDPGAGVPRPRGSSAPARDTGGSGSGPVAGAGGGRDRTPPPLWGRGGQQQEEPSMPFWLRPVDNDGEGE